MRRMGKCARRFCKRRGEKYVRRPPSLPIPSYTDVVVGDIVTTCDQEERHCQTLKMGKRETGKSLSHCDATELPNQP